MNNSLRTGVALLGGAGLVVFMMLFTWTLGNSQPTRPLTAEAAQQKAQAFLQAARLKIPHATLVSFGQQWDVQVVSHTVSFPKDKAVAKAKQVYAEYYRTRTSPHKGTYTGKVELGYVLPHGMLGGKRYPRQVPFRLRLAWAVFFWEEAVWIDAGNGSVLGGAILN